MKEGKRRGEKRRGREGRGKEERRGKGGEKGRRDERRDFLDFNKL